MMTEVNMKKFLCNVDAFGLVFGVLFTIGMIVAAFINMKFFWLLCGAIGATVVLLGTLFAGATLVEHLQSKCKEEVK